MLPGGVRMDSGRCDVQLGAAYAPAVVMIRLAGLGDVAALRTNAVAAYGKYVPRMGRAPGSNDRRLRRGVTS